MAKHKKKEAPDEEKYEEEMTEIKFQNKVVRVIKELKIEKKNVNSLEAELKEVKEHAKNLNKRNEDEIISLII